MHSTSSLNLAALALALALPLTLMLPGAAHAGNVNLALDLGNLALQFHTQGYSSPAYVLPEGNAAFPLLLPCDFTSLNGHIVIEHNAGFERVYPMGRFSLLDEYGNVISSEGAIAGNPFSVVFLPLYNLLVPGNTMMAGYTLVDSGSDYAFQPGDFPPGVAVEIRMDVAGYTSTTHQTPHTDIDFSDNVASLWVMRLCECR